MRMCPRGHVLACARTREGIGLAQLDAPAARRVEAPRRAVGDRRLDVRPKILARLARGAPPPSARMMSRLSFSAFGKTYAELMLAEWSRDVAPTAISSRCAGVSVSSKAWLGGMRLLLALRDFYAVRAKRNGY